MSNRNFVLQTERLTLRPLVSEDLSQLEQIFAEPDVVKTLLGDASTPEAIEALASMWISDPGFWVEHGFGYWGVIDRHGAFGDINALVGVVGADEPPPEVGEGPEIYYFFRSCVWGKGVASEAVIRMCDYLFDIVRLPALEALIFTELNPASARLAEKIGMRPIGRLPLVGHHLSEERARQTMQFDIWRVRNAPPERFAQTLGDAAFRIGQLLAEGAWSRAETTSSLTEAAERHERHDPRGREQLVDFIEERVEQGIEARGICHYRVRINEYLRQ